MRFIVIAGIPNTLSEGFSLVKEKRFKNKNANLIWSPLPNEQSYSKEYVEKLYCKFARAVEEAIRNESRSGVSPLNATAVVVYLDYDNSNSKIINTTFLPEALVIPVDPPGLIFQRLPPNKRNALINEFIRRIEKAIKRSEQILPAIKKEVTSRDNKTPLLLPVRNFDKPSICKLLEDVCAKFINVDSFAAVKRVTQRFETQNPRISMHDDCEEYFVNPRGIVFKSLRHARHGFARELKGERHPRSCLVRSRLRLGVSFDPKFHYDCVKQRGALPSNWHSCHHQNFTTPKGRAHVNISPNDHVR